MLPSLGFSEMVLLGIIALVVVGPKDLPLLLRKLGQWTAKLRGMAQEFRTGFDELARQAELDELKREVEALRQTTNLSNISNTLQKPLGTLESYASTPSPRYDLQDPPKPDATAVEPSAPVEPEAPSGEAVMTPLPNDATPESVPARSNS